MTVYYVILHQNVQIPITIWHDEGTRVTKVICEKNEEVVRGKKLMDPSLFPISFYYDRRDWKIEVGILIAADVT